MLLGSLPFVLFGERHAVNLWQEHSQSFAASYGWKCISLFLLLLFLFPVGRNGRAKSKQIYTDTLLYVHLSCQGISTKDTCTTSWRLVGSEWSHVQKGPNMLPVDFLPRRSVSRHWMMMKIIVTSVTLVLVKITGTGYNDVCCFKLYGKGHMSNYN